MWWWTAAATTMPRIGTSQELPEGMPEEYRTNVAVLELALAMDGRWSAVWSERLKGLDTEHPDPEYCDSLVGPDEAENVDPFAVVKRVAAKCAYSGLFVEFGVRVLAQSVRCVFYRHARYHLSVVAAGLDNAGPAFADYVKLLMGDFRLVADKLVAVGASLRHLVKMVIFLHDVSEKLSVLDDGNEAAETLRKSMQKKTKALYKAVDSLFDGSCAVTETRWYDHRNGVHVDFKDFKPDKKKKDKKKKKKKKKKDGDEDDGGEEEKGDEEDEKKDEGEEKKDEEGGSSENSMFVKANEMRILMRGVFENLLVEKMPEEMWKMIFTENIQVMDIDALPVAEEGKVKKLMKSRL